MAHWGSTSLKLRRTGWYWKVKKQHVPKDVCEAFETLELDSFKMFNNYQQVVAHQPVHMGL